MVLGERQIIRDISHLFHTLTDESNMFDKADIKASINDFLKTLKMLIVETMKEANS